MHGVVVSGTGVEANVSEFAAGKTGTTENYGDAWFVGFTDKLTVAVWVGYPDRLKSMKTEFHGSPVDGRHLSRRDLARLHDRGDRHRSAAAPESADQQRQLDHPLLSPSPSTSTPSAPVTTTPSAPATQTPSSNGSSGGGGNTPQQPQHQAPPQPAAPPQPTPQGGGGGATGGGGGGGAAGGTGGGTAPHP